MLWTKSAEQRHKECYARRCDAIVPRMENQIGSLDPSIRRALFLLSKNFAFHWMNMCLVRKSRPSTIIHQQCINRLFLYLLFSSFIFFFLLFQAILNGIFLHVLISTCKTNWLIITMAWRNPREPETIRPFKWARTQAFLKSMTHEKTMTKHKERE